MLRIRLSRFGSKKRPTYRLTISERHKDARGDVLEYLGSYNPRSNPKFVQLKEDRIKYWISQGAEASPTVHNLLVSQGVIEDKKVHAWRPKKKQAKEEESKPAKDGDNKPAAAPEGDDASQAEAKPEEKPEAAKPEEPKEEPKAEEK